MILKSIHFKKPYNQQEYPFFLPLFQSFQSMTFTKPVTILVGENGTGKSTLLRSVAYAANSISIGSTDQYNEIKPLASSLKLTWSIRSMTGFFLNSEDFVNYVKRLTGMREEAKRNLVEIEKEYQNKSLYAKNLASMPHNRTLGELEHLYEDGLEFRSHGERYLHFFQSRFKPNGLYILDEPEVPLSPMKQLTFISMLKEMVNENAQFIIATHSPMLMAVPDAEIISLDTLPPEKTRFEDLEHVQVTRSFLENPNRYLRYL